MSLAGKRLFISRLLCGKPERRDSTASGTNQNDPSFTGRDSGTFLPAADHLFVARQRLFEIGIVGWFAGYAFYVLMLGKLFSPSVPAPWYRDLGILWNLADGTVRDAAYQPGYFFPPSNAILAHIYGLLDRDLAFRVYLIVQVVAMAVAMWAWAYLIRLSTEPTRSLVMLTAFLAAFVYIHIELGMHNTNALTLCLISIALALRDRRQFSAACYALSLAIKPFSSVFILPWMAWNGYRAWTASALAWLLGFYIVIPVAWFGASTTVELYREWFFSVAAIANTDAAHQISVRAGVAALAGGAWPTSWVNGVALALQVIWLGALVGFFVPTVLRRGAASAFAFASEAAAILLIGLPLGNHQQPARSVVLFASTLIIASAIFDPHRSAMLRGVPTAILVTIAGLLYAIPIGPIFFLATLPICLLALTGLAIVRAAPPSPEANDCGLSHRNSN